MSILFEHKIEVGGRDEEYNLDDLGNKTILAEKVAGQELTITCPSIHDLASIHKDYDAFLRETWIRERRTIVDILNARNFEDVSTFVTEYLFVELREKVFAEYDESQIAWIMTNLTANQERELNVKMYNLMRPSNVHRMIYRDAKFRDELEKAIAGINDDLPDTDDAEDVDPEKK